jgi:hypothetical protein
MNMNRLMVISAAALIPAFWQTAFAQHGEQAAYGSPPTSGTAHIHQRYMQADAPAWDDGRYKVTIAPARLESRVNAQRTFNSSGYGGVARSAITSRPVYVAPRNAPAAGAALPAANYAVGYNGFSPGSYGNLNTPGVPAKQPYYGFGSLNYGPFGTGMYGSGGATNNGYGAANYGNAGYRSRYGRYGYGGFGGYGAGGYGGFGRYGYGGFGGYGYGGFGGYGYGGFSPLYGYGASGALGYGDPHSRFYFGASPINDPSTYRYGGRSAIPQVPPFQNFAQPSSLVPYSYLYVNPRTPQDPPNPQTVANPFIDSQNNAASPAGK